MATVSTQQFLLAVVALVAFSTRGYAQPQQPQKPVAFKQYLGVYTKSSPQQQIVLESARIHQLGDRTFLLGTPVAVEENSTKLTARKGVIWWIALAEVTEFYEFDDVKGYRYDGKEPRFKNP
jgi:hypothetical protein